MQISRTTVASSGFFYFFNSVECRARQIAIEVHALVSEIDRLKEYR